MSTRFNDSVETPRVIPKKNDGSGEGLASRRADGSPDSGGPGRTRDTAVEGFSLSFFFVFFCSQASSQALLNSY